LTNVTKRVTFVIIMDTTFTSSALSSVLFSKSRRAVLSLLYGHADESYYLRQIVRQTGLGLGPIQRELKQLTDVGLIQRTVQGRQVYFKSNQDSPVFKELKSIITKTAGVGDSLQSALKSFKKRIVVAFVFGSIARGEENHRSDIDLMIIGDISFSAIVKALDGVEEILGREVNPVVYPQKEFCAKLAEGHHFVNNVLGGEKIFVIGDENKLKELLKYSTNHPQG